MPKFVSEEPKLTRLVRDLNTPYSSVGEAFSRHSQKEEIASPQPQPQTQPCKKQAKHDGKLKRLTTFFKNQQTATIAEGSDYMSKGQRKRKQKRDRLSRKHDFAEYAKKLIQEDVEAGRLEKGALAGFPSSLLEALESPQFIAATTEKQTSPLKPKTQKSREKLMESEMANYSAILNFSKFQSDPIGSLNTHLTNSLNLQK